MNFACATSTVCLLYLYETVIFYSPNSQKHWKKSWSFILIFKVKAKTIYIIKYTTSF